MLKIPRTLLIIMILVVSGCASDPNRPLDQPLIQLPDTTTQAEPTDENTIAFEDISFSEQKKMHELTESSVIKDEINKFKKTGRADTRMLADGTVLFPYGLAQAKIICAPMMFSKIILQTGEKVLDVAAGDSSRWNAKVSYKGTSSSFTPIILIKPLMDDITTNLSIITDRHDYDIIITTDGDYIARIGFFYPQEDTDGIQVPSPPQSRDQWGPSTNIQIQNVRFNYIATGDKKLTWFPVNIFDDGNKVYIQMSDVADRYELPIFMKVNEKGQQEMVNYRYRQPYFIIDNLFSQGMLILRTDKLERIIRIRKKA